MSGSFSRVYKAATDMHKKSAHFTSPSSMRALPEFKKLVEIGRKSSEAISSMFTLIHYLPLEAMLALTDILGACPIKKKNRGNVDEMKHDWIRYGKKKGYIS